MKKQLLVLCAIFSTIMATAQFSGPLNYYLDRSGNPYAMDYDTVWIADGIDSTANIVERASLSFYQQVYLSDAFVRAQPDNILFKGSLVGGDYHIQEIKETTGDTLIRHEFMRDGNGNDSAYLEIDVQGPVPQMRSSAIFYYGSNGLLDSMNLMSMQQGMQTNLSQVFHYTGIDLDSITMRDLTQGAFRVVFRYYHSVLRDSLIGEVIVPNFGRFVTNKDVFGHNVLGEIIRTESYVSTQPGTPLSLESVVHYGQKAQFVSIDEEEKLSVDIYPNPAEDYVQIDLGSNYKSADIELIDLSGRTLISKSIGKSERVDIKGIPSGVYVLMLSSEDEKISRKIIKR